MHCKYVSPHTVGSAHYSGCRIVSICVTQSQNITPVRAKKRNKGREKSRECQPCLGWGWEGEAEEEEEEEEEELKIYIYTTYMQVCVHNVKEVFLQNMKQRDRDWSDF